MSSLRRSYSKLGCVLVDVSILPVCCDRLMCERVGQTFLQKVLDEFDLWENWIRGL